MKLFKQRLEQARQHRLRTGRPLVSLCCAQSLDGSLTDHPGQPLALSGPNSMLLTHQLRADHEAILVGVGTVLADNPSLTVRLLKGNDPQPVILDSQLRTPIDSFLVQKRQPWIATLNKGQRGAALEAAGARLLLLPPEKQGRVSLPALLNCLGDLGINSLMVEGGARVITSFLTQGFVDQVALTIAPLFVGGLNILDRTADSNPEWRQNVNLKFSRLTKIEYERLGDDLIVFGQLE
jgi:riboflavin-specific deaminase-like protein